MTDDDATTDDDGDKAYASLIEQACRAVRAHQLTEAERLAREALAHDPERAAAYNVLAVVRELAGHHPEAMDLLRAGLAVEPSYPPAQYNLAHLAVWPRRAGFRLGDGDEDE